MLVWMAALDIGLTIYEDFELETLKPGQEVAKQNFLIINVKQWKFTLLVSFQYFWLPKTKLNLIITSDLVKNNQDLFYFSKF